MRDPEVMLSLLREMAGNDGGWIVAPAQAHMEMSHEDGERRCHHVELLVDAGHAQWNNDQELVARITNAGYDFIDAVEKQERVHTKFLELFKAGSPYLMAAKAALEVLKMTEG